MKKLLFILAIAAVSCSDKQPQVQVQQTEATPSTETISEDIDARAIEKIQAFYGKYIFGREEATDSVIAQYCTKALAQKLRDDYNNEFADGGGYAIWEFRSGAQDGEDIQEVEKIEPLGLRGAGPIRRRRVPRGALRQPRDDHAQLARLVREARS